MTFKEKLVKLRKLKGLTQDEFASAVGVSRQAVYKWESGQSYPEVAKLLEIKLLFDISIDNLLDDTYEVVLPEKKKRKRISKEAKLAIEEEVRREEVVTAPEAAPEAVPEEKVEAPVVEAVAEEAVAVEDDAPVAEAVAEEMEASEAPAAEVEKKRGFFSKIFGKK